MLNKKVIKQIMARINQHKLNAAYINQTLDGSDHVTLTIKVKGKVINLTKLPLSPIDKTYVNTGNKARQATNRALDNGANWESIQK